MKTYKGMAYPVVKTTKGFFYGGNDIDYIKASFLTIIMTKPGERVFMPYFGTPLHTLDYNKPQELLEEDCRQMIAKSLMIWEKRFPVTDIKIRMLGHDVNITINFVNPVDLQNEHTLTLQLPLPLPWSTNESNNTFYNSYEQRS